jgi:ATP-dependent DNA helicase Q1
MGILFAGHAKLLVSLLQDIQASDKRSTMLQLVEKMKTKQKEIGWFVFSYF